MITYKNFLTEKKKHSDIDPYNEENWSEEKPRVRRRREDNEWEAIRRREKQEELAFMQERCPSAYSTEDHGYTEICCDAYEFADFLDGDPETTFAGNYPYFEGSGFRIFLKDLESIGAKDIKVGAITITLHRDNERNFNGTGEISADSVYFTGPRRGEVRELMDNYLPDELDFRDGVWRAWWD